MDKFKFLLFIDDDLPTNYYHEIILKDADVCEKYAFYDNAADALNYLESLKKDEEDYIMPDIIFLDINMPGIDGWMFLERFNALSIDNLPVIIMLTTSLNPSDKAKADKFNCVKGYNNKPLTEEFLLKAKYHVLEKGGSIEELLTEYNFSIDSKRYKY